MATKAKSKKSKKKSAPVIDLDPQLPGMEDERDEDLLRAAKRYLKEMRARKAAGEEEVAAHESLKRLMHEKGKTHYKYGKVSIVLDVNEKAKVKDDAEVALSSANGDDKSEEVSEDAAKE